jgi:hypothetical protein
LTRLELRSRRRGSVSSLLSFLPQAFGSVQPLNKSIRNGWWHMIYQLQRKLHFKLGGPPILACVNY